MRGFVFSKVTALQIVTILLAVQCAYCHLKCDPYMGVVCPEVHVESCTSPCRMTTQSYTVPKSCCCAPYCSIPAPQTACTTRPICSSNCGQETYQPVNECARMTSLCVRPPPQQMPRYGCCMPMAYGFPPPMPQPMAPSYCVQSVVVGGKAMRSDKAGDENGNGQPESVGSGGGNPGNRTGTGGGGPTVGAGPGVGGLPGRLNPGGLGLDPLKLNLKDPSLTLGGGGLNIPGLNLAGLPPLLRAALPALLRNHKLPNIGGLGGSSSKYECYLEKILDAIHDKLEPECVEPSPLIVMPQSCGCSCSPRVRVKKVRRKQRRKYMMESCEEPDIVVEEEEQPSYVFTAPLSSPRSCCCCRSRGCGCRSHCCF